MRNDVPDYPGAGVVVLSSVLLHSEEGSASLLESAASMSVTTVLATKKATPMAAQIIAKIFLRERTGSG